MAGGLFGRPFVFNEKCIVFSLICMMLFMFKPNFKNIYILYITLFIIFVVAYIAMAWYDYYFNCNLVSLRRGKYSFTGLFKPPTHVREIQEKTDNDELDKDNELIKHDHNSKMYLIYAMHLLFIVPILGYIAYYKHKTNPFIYPIMGVLAVFTAGYHGMALMIGSH